MATTRKQYSPRFKAKVALEAIRGERTLSQLATQFHVHPVQIGQWRKTALEQLADLFLDVEKDALYEEIGRLKVELDWLKKKVGLLD
jgi:transposase-like protein